MFLFAGHAWITASYILLFQRPYCLCLSPPPDQLWGSVANGAPSSNPLSLVCAPGFSSLPAHSCLFTSLQLPSPRRTASSVSCSLLLAILRSLLLRSRESACPHELPATWSSAEQFLLPLWHLTVAEPSETFISITTGWSFMRIEARLTPLALPCPSHVLIFCPLTLTLLFSTPNYPSVFTLTHCLFPP